MPVLLVSKPAAIHQTVAALHASIGLHPYNETVFLSFADIPAMDVMAFLGSWGLMARREGTRSSSGVNPKPLRLYSYLASIS